MKRIGSFIAVIFALLILSGALYAQTYTPSFMAYESKGGVSVLFATLNGSTDTDSTTFIDWTPISESSSLQWWGQTYDSINQATQDTVTVYVLGTGNITSAPTFMDTVTIIGNTTTAADHSGAISISSTIKPPYIGFRAVTSAKIYKRKLSFTINGTYVTGVDQAALRQRIYDGKYGNGQ